MRIRNEDDCPDYITKLLRRNSDDLRSDSRASRYGRFNLVGPFYDRETEAVEEDSSWHVHAKEGHPCAFKNALKNIF